MLGKAYRELFLDTEDIENCCVSNSIADTTFTDEDGADDEMLIGLAKYTPVMSTIKIVWPLSMMSSTK